MSHRTERNKSKSHAPGKMIAGAAALLGALCAVANSHAGAFTFAGETHGVDVITHPTGYSGSGGPITVNVCITGTDNTAAMEQSVRNVIAVYNRLQPTTGNLQTGRILNTEVDFESVLLHEVGHCIGLAHPNLATESGFSGADQNYTKTTTGGNGFDIDAGTDGVRGSADDSRGDDVNLHWFRTDNNNPFTIDAIIDSTTYRRNTADLPLGHTFAANADRTVGTDILNTPNSEAALQQGTWFGEIQRTLVADDVATLRYAMAGFDEQAGTADDYTFSLNLDTTGTDCDINIQFDNQSGFASCGVSAWIRGSHFEIASATVHFNVGYNWHFNTSAPCSESRALMQGEWTMISLPCDVGISTGNTVADVFGDDLGGNYDTDWAVYERDAANNSYSKLTTDSPLETGKGYWIVTDLASQTIDVQGQYNSVPDFDLQAAANGRYNLVGHPLDISIDWTDAQFIDGADILTLDQVDPDIGGGMRACEQDPPAAGCIVSRILYKWNGAAYQAFDGETPGSEGTLNKFDGIWVNSFKPGVQLRIPSSAGANAVGAADSSSRSTDLSRSNSGAAAKPQAFYVRLIAESGGLVDPGNLLGYLPDSRDGYDKHDLKEIPPFSTSYLTIVFPHEQWEDFAGDYTTDFRSTHGKRWARWRFDVQTSLPVGTEIILRWEAPETVLKSARLIDLASRKKIKVGKNGEYRFQVKGETHHFVWRMRRPANEHRK